MRVSTLAGLWIGLILPAIASGQATMEVSDTLSHGTLGDSELSFDEAIQLANGDIGLNNLSNAEKSFVTGVPGPTVADLITFSFTNFPGSIFAEAELTPLHAGMDTIDVIAGRFALGDIVYDGGGSFGGPNVTSHDTTVRALEVANCAGHCISFTSLAGGDTSGGLVEGCLLRDSEFGFVIEGSDGGTSTIGSAAAPIILRDNELSGITTADDDSRATLVSGGSGDDNQVHVIVERQTSTNNGGGALEVRGADTDAGESGERNVVDVAVFDSEWSRSGFSRSGAAVRLFGADAAATASADNHASLRLDHLTLSTFTGAAVQVDTSAGNDNDVELDIVLCEFLQNRKGGVSVRGGEGDQNDATVRMQSVLVQSSTGGAGLAIVSNGGGTGQTLNLTAVDCSFLDGSDDGVRVTTAKSGTVSAWISDCFVERNDGAGLLLDASSASADPDLTVQRSTFRDNADGVIVAAGASSSFDLDLGGGPLASRGGNTFEGNVGCGVFNQTTTVVFAQDNDWGDATGPSDCDAADSDGIPDPTGNGDGVGEYTEWSPFVAHDQNPQLIVTGSLDPISKVTIVVEDGVSGSKVIFWAGLAYLDPAVDGNIGNHWFLGVPFFRILKGTVDTPIGPFDPPPELEGFEVYFQAGVLQAGTFEMTNPFALN